MSRYFDLSQNAVLFSDCMLPMEAFMTTQDTIETNLVSQIFDFAKSLAELRLSDIALALYSAYILLQDGKFFSIYCLVGLESKSLIFCRSTGITECRKSPKFKSSGFDRSSARAERKSSTCTHQRRRICF